MNHHVGESDHPPIPTLDLRELDLDGFRRWLALQFARWGRDPAFVARRAVRDLRRATPALRPLEDAYRRAVDADAGGRASARLSELEEAVANADKAIAGLLSAAAADPGRRAAMEDKRVTFEAKRRALDSERAALALASPARQAVIRVRRELDALKAAAGLDAAEARLKSLQAAGGRRVGGKGEAFERISEEVTRTRILPAVGGPGADLTVLRAVRLGAADIELDLLVVRGGHSPGEVVDVLAVIESKRNINDTGHGFVRRQANLTWLTGDRGGYEPDSYRTRAFPTGHFAHPAVHRQAGSDVHFGPTSFRRFARDAATGFFLDGLYWITRAGPVWGVSGATLARIAARVASDCDLDLADGNQLAEFFAWCRSLAGPIEAPDVRKFYATRPGLAVQFLALDHLPG